MTILVCFSRLVPVPGIGYAGGGLLLSYLEQTADVGSRVLVVPNEPRNRNVSCPSVSDVLVVGPPSEARDFRTKVDNYLSKEIRAGFAKHYFRKAVRNDPRVAEALRRADIVEYHWQDMASLAPWAVKVSRPGTRHLAFFHDVVSQRLSRRANDASGPHAILLRVAAAVHVAEERRISRQVDASLVLSDKDAAFFHGGSGVVVARPPVRAAHVDVGKRELGETAAFIFVAAFDRDENIEAAVWLCASVWPALLKSVPGSTLRLVGTDELGRASDLSLRTPNCVSTGYVADLGKEYGAASAVLVPLRHGAGVKLKTLEAMAAGVPLVSTSVGAEGIDAAGAYAAVHDDAASFAQAAADIATDGSGAYEERASRAREWVAVAHGDRQFRRAIREAMGLQARA